MNKMQAPLKDKFAIATAGCTSRRGPGVSSNCRRCCSERCSVGLGMKNLFIFAAFTVTAIAAAAAAVNQPVDAPQKVSICEADGTGC